MFWADRIARKINKSGKYQPYWVDDMKTPSGRVHVGSLRGVIIHDLIFKALKDAGAKLKESKYKEYKAHMTLFYAEKGSVKLNKDIKPVEVTNRMKDIIYQYGGQDKPLKSIS